MFPVVYPVSWLSFIRTEPLVFKLGLSQFSFSTYPKHISNRIISVKGVGLGRVFWWQHTNKLPLCALTSSCQHQLPEEELVFPTLGRGQNSYDKSNSKGHYFHGSKNLLNSKPYQIHLYQHFILLLLLWSSSYCDPFHVDHLFI